MREIWKKLHWIATFLLKRLLPKKSLARTSFLAKKQFVPPKAGLRILLEKWGEISGTRFARPTLWVLLYLFLQNLSIYTITLEPILCEILDERKSLPPPPPAAGGAPRPRAAKHTSPPPPPPPTPHPLPPPPPPSPSPPIFFKKILKKKNPPPPPLLGGGAPRTARGQKISSPQP